jgi:signal transduction histidine kinase
MERPDRAVSRLLVQAIVFPAVLSAATAAVLALEVVSLVSHSRWVQHTDEVIASTQRARTLLADREAGLRGVLLGRSPEFLAPLTSAEQGLPAEWARLSRLVSDNPPQIERVRRARELDDRWTDFARRVLAKYDAGDDDGTRQLVLTGEGRGAMTEVRALLDTFVGIEERLRDERTRTEQFAAVRVIAVSVALLLLVGFGIGIAARRQLRSVARRYGQALAATEETSRLRDEFLTIAAHELRTPLTALQLQLQRLRRTFDRGATSQEMVAQLQLPMRQARRLGALIEQLLDAQTLASGEPLDMQLATADLGDAVRAAIAHLREEERLSCRIEARIEGELRGTWDYVRLERLAFVLLRNACKYGGGSLVAVEVRRDGEDRVLTVSDRGIGIPPDQQEQIFDRFGRAASSRSYGGFGLSLFGARRVAEAHGGSLRVSSELGEGATFTLRLPPEPPPGANRGAASEGDANRARSSAAQA